MSAVKTKVNKSLFYVLPVLSILIVIALGVFLVQPRIDKILQTQENKKQEVAIGQKLDAKIQTLKKLEDNKTDLLAQLADLKVALPDQKDVPQLIIQIQKIAESSDITLLGIQLTPGKLINDTTPAATKIAPDVTLSVSFRGNLEAVKTFLSKIYKSKRLVNMDTLSLATGTGQDDEGQINAVSNMIAYYQLKPLKPKDETEDVPTITADEQKVYETLKEYQTPLSEQQ